MTDYRNSLKEQEGIHFFAFQCSKLNYIYRDVLQHDNGVDCEIELTQSIPVKSPIIAVQVKARTKAHVTDNDEISITVSKQNLEYWSNFGRPVILVVYTSENDPIYWVRVDTLKRRTVKVPRSNVFDASTLPEFTRIINEYYNKLAKDMKLKEISKVLADLGFDDDIDSVLIPLKGSLFKANDLVNHHLYKEASDLYGSLAKIYKNHCLIRYNFGLVLLYLDEVDQVFEVAVDMLRDFPDSYEPLELLAGAFASVGEYEASEENLKKALYLEPNAASVWNSLGLIHYWCGDFSRAIQEFEKSLRIEENESVHFNLSLCLTAIKQYEEALLHYDAAIELHPNFYDAYNNKGLLLKDLWRLEEAIDSFKKAIITPIESHKALCNLAFLLKDMGDNTQALEYYKQGLNLAPDDLNIHLNIGLIYCRISKLDKASHHLTLGRSMLSLAEESASRKIGFMDIGYEVAYIITVEVRDYVLHVVDVQDICDKSLFRSIPKMRTIVDYAQKNKVTSSLGVGNPSNKIINGLTDRVLKTQKNKEKKSNEKGMWVWAFPDRQNELPYHVIGIFDVENYSYYHKITKEIKRKLQLSNVIEQVDKSHIEIDGKEYVLNVGRTTVTDSMNRIIIKIEDRKYQEVYFNINFNGYYLSSISKGNIADTFPYLLHPALNATLVFTCRVDNENALMFAIKDVKTFMITPKSKL